MGGHVQAEAAPLPGGCCMCLNTMLRSFAPPNQPAGSSMGQSATCILAGPVPHACEVKSSPLFPISCDVVGVLSACAWCRAPHVLCLVESHVAASQVRSVALRMQTHVNTTAQPCP